PLKLRMIRPFRSPRNLFLNSDLRISLLPAVQLGRFYESGMVFSAGIHGQGHLKWAKSINPFTVATYDDFRSSPFGRRVTDSVFVRYMEPEMSITTVAATDHTKNGRKHEFTGSGRSGPFAHSDAARPGRARECKGEGLHDHDGGGGC